MQVELLTEIEHDWSLAYSFDWSPPPTIVLTHAPPEEVEQPPPNAVKVAVVAGTQTSARSQAIARLGAGRSMARGWWWPLGERPPPMAVVLANLMPRPTHELEYRPRFRSCGR